MKTAVLFLLSLPLLAQTVPNGAIYQSAAAQGIAYVSPSSGAQILATKAALNWKTLLNTAAGDGSIGAVVLGLTKAISMSSGWTVGLALFHGFWDTFGSGVLATSVPNPQPLIQSLLQPNQATALAGTCAEGSMLAPVKGAKTVGPVTITGASVTFSPQSPVVLVYADGSKIRGFGVWDVLICPAFVSAPPG